MKENKSDEKLNEAIRLASEVVKRSQDNGFSEYHIQMCKTQLALLESHRKLREALDNVRGYGTGDIGHQQLCGYITLEASEALTESNKVLENL